MVTALSERASTPQDTALHEDQSQVPQLVGAFVTCGVLAYLAVILRLVSRRMQNQPYKADEWFIVSSLVGLSSYVSKLGVVNGTKVFTTAFLVLDSCMTKDGLGRHEHRLEHHESKVLCFGTPPIIAFLRITKLTDWNSRASLLVKFFTSSLSLGSPNLPIGTPGHPHW